jgi:hypothetical protein
MHYVCKEEDGKRQKTEIISSVFSVSFQYFSLSPKLAPPAAAALSMHITLHINF